MSTQVNLFDAVQQFIRSQRIPSRNNLTVTRYKGGCKVAPKGRFEMSLLADIWFKRFCEFAKSNKASVELHANITQGGRGVRFMGRTSYTAVTAGRITLTSPDELFSWEYEDFVRVYSWHFFIAPK